MNDRRCQRDEGLETQVRLAGTHGYPSVFFKFAKVVFDQVPPFVGFLVELRWKLPVGFRRYDCCYAAIFQIISQPIRVKSPISQQMPGGKVADQRIGLAQILGLSGQQAEINEIAECIGQCQNFRRYASTRAPNGLEKRPPFAP